MITIENVCYWYVYIFSVLKRKKGRTLDWSDILSALLARPDKMNDNKYPVLRKYARRLVKE